MGRAPRWQPPRRRYLGGTEPPQQGADEIIRGPDLTGHHVRDFRVADVGAVDVHRGPVHGAHIGAQLLEDLQKKGDIADLGNVLDPAHAFHQQGGGDNGHRGVLGAADLDLSVQRFAPVNHILRQNRTFYSPAPSGSTERRVKAPEAPSRTGKCLLTGGR